VRNSAFIFTLQLNATMSTRTTLCFAIALLFCSTAASAQENTTRTSEGDRALLFSINGFGDFGVRGTVAGNLGSISAGDSAFDASTPVYGIGAKYFIAPRTALRLALGFGIFSQGDGTGGIAGAGASALAISPAIELHLVQSGAITGYVGGFASLAIRSSTNGAEATAEVSRSATTVSLGVMLGVEFFPWNGISFGAEYQLGANFNSFSSTTNGESVDLPGTVEVGIGTVAVKLGVYL
jgi:opacity protein-like surface antigen